MFLACRPSAQQIEGFVAASRELPLSYSPIGLAGGNGAGFDVDEQTVIVGRGEQAFDRARRGLGAWRHFELGWVEVFPKDAPVTAGTAVAVLAKHAGVWSLNGCRVVYLIGSADTPEFGYAYGTLMNHAESGEEIFKVSLHADTGDVAYSIRAVSRPRAALARLGYPVTRRFQARFRRDSARALQRAIAE